MWPRRSDFAILLVMKVTTILPAAGRSRRFGDAPGRRSKLEIDLKGRPVFLRAAEAFLDHPAVTKVLLAVSPDTIDQFRFKWGDQLGFRGIQVIPGGKAERSETVLRALEAVGDDCTHVEVHDAARPLVSRQLVDRVFEAAERHAAVIPAVPVGATLKRVAEAQVGPAAEEDPIDAILGTDDKDKSPIQQVIETIDRADVVEVQTPQVFELSLFRRAYAQLEGGTLDPADVTDDAALVEALGEPVYVVDGEVTNLKITQPGDIALVRAVLSLTSRKDAEWRGRQRMLGEE